MELHDIIKHLPYKYPFVFVDEITFVNEANIVGNYTFDGNLPFYEGHFKNKPVTPGVILTECMAQIGLVSLGIYMLGQQSQNLDNLQIALTSTAMDFYKPVFPNERVIVKSKKEYFRFNKLKCRVEMYNSSEELVCRGTIAGMVKTKDEG